MNIATLITFCTNDYRYLSKCIEEVKSFSKKIIITACDHFFDGGKENHDLLHHCYQEQPDCTFIEYSYMPDSLYTPYIQRRQGDVDWNSYWHSTGRYIAYFFLPKDIDYILFLDVDEIIHAASFCEWLQTKKFLQYDALRFNAYYYFREAKYRAVGNHNLALLAKKTALTPHIILNPDDRFGLFAQIKGNKTELVNGLNDKPMLHHYSGVKKKEEWLKKSTSWGHSFEKDWQSLIEEEYARPFAGKDFTFGYTYETIDPYFDPLKIEPKKQKTMSHFSNVYTVDKNTIARLEIQHTFSI